MALMLAISGSAAVAATPAPAGTPRFERVVHGTLVHRVAELRGAADTESWFVRTPSGLIPLTLRRGTTVLPGTAVTVRGTSTSSGGLSVGSNGLHATGTSGAGTTQSNSTSAQLAVILFTLPGAGTLGITPADARDTYFGATNSAAQFYQEASNGAFALTGDVMGPYDLSTVDVSDCLVDDWADAAQAAASAAGVDLSGYSNFAFVFPWMSVCPWAGMADVGGANSYINGPAQGILGLYHAAHELGHNFGSGHAHAYLCSSDGTAESIGPASDCTTDEYGDPFSVMGNGVTRLPNGWERIQMGFLNAADQQIISTPGTRRVRIGTLETGAGVRLLRVLRADGSFLDVEYLHPYGSFDTYAASDPAVRGVLLELVAADASAETDLLDATPSTPTFDDASLAPGRSLTDVDGGISVTVVSIDATGATLDVTVVAKSSGSDADTSAPMAPAALGAASHSPGVALSWQPALDNVAATSYRVSRDGQLLGQTAGDAYLDGDATNAAHTYSVVAVDASGNVGPAAIAQFTPADHVAPSSPANVTVRRASATTARVKWAVATDNIGVAHYRVRVDDRAPITTVSLSATLKSLAKGIHRIWVWAVDSSGNIGPSVRVTVRS